MSDERRRTFDEDAALYDRARPGYPAELFADLVELTGIGSGSRVIEIGPGTGQATRDLVRCGAKITAVELGDNLAARLAAALPEVDVEVAAFEDWAPRSPADLVTSFTAWHWVDRRVRAERVHATLKPGGHLATVTTDHVRGGTVDFFVAAQECYLRWDPATDADEPFLTPDEMPPVLDEIDESPLFGPAIRRRFRQTITYTTQQYLDVLRTYSGHRALSPDRRRGLLGCLGSLIEDRHHGLIRKEYLYELRVASRLEPSI